MPRSLYALTLLTAAVTISACSRGPEPFRMKINFAKPMRGFVLNGVGIGGTVEQGCIANYDAFVVKRDGEVIYESTASIMMLDGGEGFEAAAGQKVEFYLRGAPDEAVKVGDIMEAKETTCGKDESENQNASQNQSENESK